MNTDAITIEYGSGILSAEDFVDDGFILTESLCSDSQLAFGSCEAAAVEVQIASTAASFVGQTLIVKLGDNVLGRYKVVSDERASDGETRVLKAYDSLYEINGLDVAEWYAGIDWTLVTTLRQFRDSFFQYLGITQASGNLVNDNMAVGKTMETSSCSGATILRAICEINGVFGHINANGYFQYVSLAANNATTVNADEVLDTITEDFTVPSFDSVLIRTEEGDIGGQYPASSAQNQYIITGNFLCYGKTSVELQSIAQNTLSKIGGRTYVPFEAELECQGNIALGGKVTIPTEPTTFTSYVLQRKLVGFEDLEEYFAARGAPEYVPDVNSARNQMVATAQRINKLTSTVEGTESRVAEIEKDYAKESIIHQLPHEILLQTSETSSAGTPQKATISLTIKDGNGAVVSTEAADILFNGLVTYTNNAKKSAIDTAATDATSKTNAITNHIYKTGTTTIDGGIIDTESLFSRDITATNMHVTGGSIHIDSDTGSSDDITLNFKNEVNKVITAEITPKSFRVLNDETLMCSYLSDSGVYLQKYTADRNTYTDIGGIRAFSNGAVGVSAENGKLVLTGKSVGITRTSISDNKWYAVSLVSGDEPCVCDSIYYNPATKALTVDGWELAKIKDFSLAISGTTLSLMHGTTEINHVTVPSGGSSYTLPTASASTLGGIKVGSNLSISNGVLSAVDTTYSNREPLSGGTNVSLVTDGEKYKWNNKQDKITTSNKLAYSLISGTPTIPTTLPASDVYAWAKASTKPTYTASEVGAAASNHTHSYLPLAGGTMTGAIKKAGNSYAWYNNQHYASNGSNFSYYSEDAALITQTTYSGWQAIWQAPNADGGQWSQGNYANNHYINHFKKGTTTNSPDHQWIFKPDGTFISSSTIYVGSTAVSLDGHTHSNYATTATVNTKLSKPSANVGSDTQPIYYDYATGAFKASTYDLSKFAKSDVGYVQQIQIGDVLYAPNAKGKVTLPSSGGSGGGGIQKAVAIGWSNVSAKNQFTVNVSGGYTMIYVRWRKNTASAWGCFAVPIVALSSTAVEHAFTDPDGYSCFNISISGTTVTFYLTRQSNGCYIDNVFLVG